MAGTPKDDDSRELLGDLESIRTLLDEESDQPTSDAETEPKDVPVLDDVVDTPDVTPTEGPGSNLTDDVFASLMSDGWKAQTDTLLDAARSSIDEQAEAWSPEDTDELNDALRVRIDEAIYESLQRMLREHIDELRADVLDAISDELRLRVDGALKDDPAPKD
ncbi:MAG: hypothetical protein AAGI15_06730 [Pseudomonadota bacterium]